MADSIQDPDAEQSYHSHALCLRHVEFPKRRCEEKCKYGIGHEIDDDDREPNSTPVGASLWGVNPVW